MAKVLVAYYSRSGNTRAMAQAVARGASAAGADVVIRDIREVKVRELLDFDGIVFGSPTYYGLPAAPIKELLDESVSLHGRLSGKVGAAFTSAANIGGGNETAILAMLQAFLIHGMIVQGAHQGDHYGTVGINAPDERATSQCEELGGRVADLAAKLFG